MLDNDVQAIVDEVKAEIKTTYDGLQKKYENLDSAFAEFKKSAVSSESFETRKAEFDAEIKKLAAQADALDVKLSRPGRPGNQSEAKSIGRMVIESDEYKSLAKRGSGSTGLIEVKTITNAGNDIGSQTVNALVPRDRLGGVVGLPEQELTIRDLLPVGQTSSTSIEYGREDVFTNSGAPVAENTATAASNITYTLETANVREIGHHIPVSRLALSDAPMLQSFLDQRLTYGLKLIEEQQLLLGDGTGQNLNGLHTQAATFNQSVAANGIPGGVGASMVDIARWAKLQVRQSLYPATAIVLNPEDWATIEMLKDADDNYLFSAFTAGAEARLWGMRVVQSDSITAGSWLVGSFQLGAQIWDRQMATIEISTEHSDNFTKRMATVQATERLALTVYRPAAFLKGTFTLTA